MDRIYEDFFTNIYQGDAYYIGRVGSTEYDYYLITQDQGAAQQTIGIDLSDEEVKTIIENNGDLNIVERIVSKKVGRITIWPSRNKD